MAVQWNVELCRPMHEDLLMAGFAEVSGSCSQTSENGDGELLGVELIKDPEDFVCPGGRTQATVRFLILE
jgi:hypothetical protein